LKQVGLGQQHWQQWFMVGHGVNSGGFQTKPEPLAAIRVIFQLEVVLILWFLFNGRSAAAGQR
jgi:hypothetical protein